MGWGFNHLFLPVLHVGESKVKVPADSAAGESPPPGLQMTTILLCPPTIERGSSGLSFLSYRGTDPIAGPCPHDFITSRIPTSKCHHSGG